ncbi:hypothetical protein QBC34DRAFT_389666 [Podospora aff. communis PSN243]|uniref:MARVEL domain-containing protein n=1 Tax=Podospora aff. communis PSN243 TaxID=3040156 RepID=A0AAV9H5G2_9PEZI|nr:hypothetical protein QBC34DRAFT_389666 [Podospora aff. communis PSN243]
MAAWLDPILWAGITSFLYSTSDLVTTIWCHNRSHHMTRIIYDGLLAAGFAISTGFFADRAWPYIKMDPKGLQRQGNPDGDTIGALGIVIFMASLVQIVIYIGYSIGGVRDTLRIRRQGQQGAPLVEERREVTP